MSDDAENKLPDSDTQTEVGVADTKTGIVAIKTSNSLLVKPNTTIIARSPNAVYRLGCSFCMHTLNPDDSELMLRTFVRVNDLVYHQYCWSKYVDKKPNVGTITPIEVTIPPPPQLEAIERHALVLYAGPSNSVFDQPLGISASMVSLDNANPQEFVLLNNMDYPAKLSRNLGPSWAYLDLGRYHEVADWIQLSPNDMETIKIYPHPIRPSIAHTNVYFNETQHIQLNTAYFTVAPIFSAVVIFAIGLWHLVAISNWLTFANLSRLPEGFWGSAWNLMRSGPIVPIGLVILTGGLVLGWFVFMMPARALWILYGLFMTLGNSRLAGRIAPLKHYSQQAQEIVWFQFQQQRIPRLMQNPIRLLAISLITGFALALVNLPLILLIGLIAGFLGSGLPSFLLVLIYTGGLLFLINKTLVDYEIFFFERSPKYPQARHE